MSDTLKILTLSAAFLSVIYFLFYCYKPSSLPKIIIKTASTALLSIATFIFGVPLLGSALAASSAGDTFLAVDSEKTFMAGVGSFAVAHILYIILFLQHPQSDWNLLTIGFSLYAAITILCLITAMAIILWPRAGDLRIPVMIYIPIIAAMGLSALTINNPMIIGAAALFMLSDTVLALETFVIDDNSPIKKIMPFTVWLTYWPAQLLFLLAFLG